MWAYLDNGTLYSCQNVGPCVWYKAWCGCSWADVGGCWRPTYCCGEKGSILSQTHGSTDAVDQPSSIPCCVFADPATGMTVG